jgi:hypothetical protein
VVKMSKGKKQPDRFAVFEKWEREIITDALFEQAKRRLPMVPSIDDQTYQDFARIMYLAQEALGQSTEEES